MLVKHLTRLTLKTFNTRFWGGVDSRGEEVNFIENACSHCIFISHYSSQIVQMVVFSRSNLNVEQLQTLGRSGAVVGGSSLQLQFSD